ERLLSGWSRGDGRGIALAGSLLSLARPEGLPISLALGIAWSLGPGRRSHGLRRWLPWLPFGVALGVVALYRGLTGYWLGTSFADKSLLANYGLLPTAGLVAHYLTDVLRGLLMGAYPAEAPIGFSMGQAPFYFPPLSLLALLLAAARPLD